MNSLKEYSISAVAAFNARHAAADDLIYNTAGFWREGKTFVVEVRGHVVATPSTLKELEAFCLMHNNRLMGGAS